MTCTRFQSDGMRLLDGELTAEEKKEYELHSGECEDCRSELKGMGRIIAMTDEFRLRTPDDEFWDGYWRGIYRRSERSTGFLLTVLGIIAVLMIAVFKAVTSPSFLSYEGISIAAILIGLVVIFISVVRERYHESKNDPYKGVRR